MSNFIKQPQDEEIENGCIDPSTGNELDPVCGMKVRKHAFYQAAFLNKMYKFCNEDCLKSFVADPSKYTDPSYQEALFKRVAKNQPTHNDARHMADNKDDIQPCCCSPTDPIKSCCSHNSKESDVQDLSNKITQDDIGS